MTQDTRDIITWVLGTLLSSLAILGLGVRFLLVPYLRDQLVKPVASIEQQVTENSHQRPHSPTLPDRIDDLQTGIDTLSRVMDGHLDTSDRWLDHITHELRILHERLRALTERENTP